MKKKIPTFKTDRAAERFVANSDLTQYDLSGARAVQFEFEPKAAQLKMRLPANLLDALIEVVRAAAAANAGTAGPSADRSQDFLYDDAGLPK